MRQGPRESWRERQGRRDLVVGRIRIGATQRPVGDPAVDPVQPPRQRGNVLPGKPAPDLFLHAAERMGADPARCAVVEDTLYGVLAARAAGMRVFGYAGLTAPERLQGEATVVFEDMRQLPRLLANASP